MAGESCIDRRVEILRRPALKNEGMCACIQRPESQVDIGKGGKDDDPGQGRMVPDSLDGGEDIARHAQVEDENLRFVSGNEGQCFVGGTAGANDVIALVGRKQRRYAHEQGWVIVNESYARRTQRPVAPSQSVVCRWNQGEGATGPLTSGPGSAGPRTSLLAAIPTIPPVTAVAVVPTVAAIPAAPTVSSGVPIVTP